MDIELKAKPGSILDPHGTRDLEQAVIEAAKAARHQIEDVSHELDALVAALDALAAEENTD